MAPLERRTAGHLGPALLGLMRREVHEALDPTPQEAFREVLSLFRGPSTLGSLMDDFYLDVRHHRFVVLGLQLGGLFFQRAHPYFEPELHDQVSELPLADRLGSGFHRQAIGLLAPELMTVVWDKTGKPLRRGPSPLGWMPQRWLPPFLRSQYHEVPGVNYSMLFRTEWRTWLGDIVLTIVPILAPWVRANQVLQLLDEHLCGTRDHTRALGVLITFGLWARWLNTSQRIVTSMVDLLSDAHSTADYYHIR